MSDTPIECPECGRNFPAASNLQGHVNASNDHPSWAAIRTRLDDEETDRGEEGGKARDGRDLETEPEAPSEGPEGNGSTSSGESTNEQTDDEGGKVGDGGESVTAPEGPEEGPESAPNEDDMPTEDEIERQRAQYEGGSESGRSPSEEESDPEGGKARDGSDPEGADEGAEGPLSGAVGALVPSVDKTTIVLLVGLAVVLALLYRYMGDDETETSQETESVPVVTGEDGDDQDGGDVATGGAGLIAAEGIGP